MARRHQSGASRPELDRYAWQKKRARVKARDGHACVRCCSTRKLSVHHIIKARFGGSDDEANLITVCSRCHALLDRPNGGYRATKKVSPPAARFSREKLVELAGPFSRAW
jgi:5-methylcytosine-specific restriction endonuclease McrA